MSVNGSSAAPKRFLSFLQPFATPLINPAERLKQTTILSASARLYVRRIRASVSNRAIVWWSPRDKVEEPGQCETDNDERGEDLQTIEHALMVSIFRHRSEDHGSKRSKQTHHEEMSHSFLPAAISNASSIVR